MTQRVAIPKGADFHLVGRRQPGRSAMRQVPSVPLSTIVLAIALMAATPQARAVSECGGEGGGADTINCSGASYATGIQYTGSDGLTLNLNNPAMVVQTNAGGAAVFLQGGAVNTRDLAINASSLTSVTGLAARPSRSTTRATAMGASR